MVYDLYLKQYSVKNLLIAERAKFSTGGTATLGLGLRLSSLYCNKPDQPDNRKRLKVESATLTKGRELGLRQRVKISSENRVRKRHE